MELTIKPAEEKNFWIVEAYGYSGDADGYSGDAIYSGPDKDIAIRTYLEAKALSKAYPHGRGGGSEYSYSRLVKPLFDSPDGADGRHRPFAWARSHWSTDSTSDGEIDATIQGAEIFWIDEHGAKLWVSAALSPREKELIHSTPAADPKHRYPIEALASAFEALALERAVADPGRGKSSPAL